MGELLVVVQNLVEDSPHVVHYREKLADVHITRAELLTALGKPEPALAEIAKALTISRYILDKFNTGSSPLMVRGRGFLAQARALAASGKVADSQTAWANAKKVFELAQRVDPDNYRHKRGAAEATAALKPPTN